MKKKQNKNFKWFPSDINFELDEGSGTNVWRLLLSVTPLFPTFMSTRNQYKNYTANTNNDIIKCNVSVEV